MPAKMKTVFVLGAGASAHCGYPLGAKLKHDILTRATRGNAYEGELPERFTTSDVKSLAHRLQRDIGSSIDVFLEREQDDRHTELLGKYLIAYHLKKLEVVNNLFPPEVDSTLNWYPLLFQLLFGSGREPA